MLKYASMTKTGNRGCNEDYLKISSVADRHGFIVCDGLGGHNAGDLAAKIAGDAIADELYLHEDMSDYLPSAFERAQKQILLRQRANEAQKDMRTTAVCMASDEAFAYIGHVGDSRFYGFKKDGAYVRTLDHSMPQLLVRSNVIVESEIRHHPNRSVLLKVLGDETDEALCDLMEPLALCDFSAFLLCSDGFWEFLNEKDMLSTLHDSSSPQEWLDEMVAIVESNGNGKTMDNYTAITVFVV